MALLGGFEISVLYHIGYGCSEQGARGSGEGMSLFDSLWTSHGVGVHITT